MPCPSSHTRYNAMHAMSYHKRSLYPPGHAICQPGHTIYHAMSASPYHMPVSPSYILCHAHQAIPCIMPCLPSNTVYHTMPSQAIPNIMPCPPGLYINNAIPATPYHKPSCHACYGKGPKCLVIICTTVMSVVKENDNFL